MRLRLLTNGSASPSKPDALWDGTLTTEQEKTLGLVTCRACSESRRKHFRLRLGSSYVTYSPKMLIAFGRQLRMPKRIGFLTSRNSASSRTMEEECAGSTPEESSI